MKMGKNLFLIWIIAMFFITFTCTVTYLVTQQALRLGANAIPAMLAKDTAIHLQGGLNPAASIPANKVDASQSDEGFVMIYDKNKNLIATSGTMKTKDPQYPKGVLEYVSKNGEDRVTWQTLNGLRFATVAIKTDNYYIVGARSLFEIENIIEHITQLVMYIWLACLIGSAMAMLVIYAFMKKYLIKIEK
ncbi:hypothetical protein NDK43_12115 [Neobacillus pocheonensis]|uniref:Uncharacterized protein n=1 Tax=Neobacillus pocheonensis TaxID=363869 RepID=A0ABT0W9J5_9BACI|nr:hypothetical protein [Neobacillus pocheonensis]